MSKIREQEVEISTLLSVIDSLNKYVVELNMQVLPNKYQKYEELVKVYDGAEKMIE